MSCHSKERDVRRSMSSYRLSQLLKQSACIHRASATSQARIYTVPKHSATGSAERGGLVRKPALARPRRECILITHAGMLLSVFAADVRAQPKGDCARRYDGSSASGIVPRSLREACSGPAPGVKAPRACSGGRGDGDDRPHVVSRDPAGSPARNEFATTRSSASRRSSTCPISGASSTSPTASSSGRNSNSRDRLHVLPQRRRLAVPPLDDPPLSLDA